MKIQLDKLEDAADVCAIVLALAELSIARPGWTEYLRGCASQFPAVPSGEELFEEYRRNHAMVLTQVLQGGTAALNSTRPARWPH